MNGDSHIIMCLFLCSVSICFPFFHHLVLCFYSVMVQPSSHRTPKDISGGVFIAGEILILLSYLDITVSGKVVIGFYSVLLPYGSLASVVCSNLTGSILGVSLWSNAF